jgi:pimeloyl-ACP methyl ester carboxylesterase
MIAMVQSVDPLVDHADTPSVRSAAMMPLRTPHLLLVGGRLLAYEEASPPNPSGVVILLVGLGAKRQGWYRQMPAFGGHYRTIALDYRDVGDSDQATEPYTIVDLAEDAAGMMRALGVDRAHFVGISMGGFIALELAIRHPEIVEKLVLVVTSARGHTHVSPSHETMAMMMPVPGEEIGEAARRVCAGVSGPGFAERAPNEFDTFAAIARYRPMTEAAYFRQLSACRGHDVADRLDRIQAPTLVIHGDADPLVPLANGLHLARSISGANVIIYPGVGHIPEVERADQFNRDILAFLGA